MEQSCHQRVSPCLLKPVIGTPLHGFYQYRANWTRRVTSDERQRNLYPSCHCVNAPLHCSSLSHQFTLERIWYLRPYTGATVFLGLFALFFFSNALWTHRATVRNLKSSCVSVPFAERVPANLEQPCHQRVSLCFL